MDLLIVGASARAAAFSALRAGLSPAAVDLFADRDLAAVAPCVRVERRDYPGGLLVASDSFPACPWVYTGGLENEPGLIEAMTRRRPLWGNGAGVLRAVRDPTRVAESLEAAGIPAPEVRRSAAGIPRDGSWLRKPLASSGGERIEWFLRHESDQDDAWYYQRRLVGVDASAVFVGRRTGAALAGVTRQLLGRPGAPFGYRGNLAPWPLAPGLHSQVNAIGNVLASAFGLVGLFGVDFVIEGGRAWAVEVNPRYTASVEVIELATGFALLASHRDACEGREPVIPTAPATRFVAKEIVFAPGAGTLEDTDVIPKGHSETPEAADLPTPGTRFLAGDPVLTVFARGEDPGAALLSLDENRRRWQGRFRCAR